MPQPLLSRTLDPLLAIFAGCFAYYHYENHPRTGIPEEIRLLPLLRWKWAKYNRQRQQHLRSLDNVQ